MSCQKRVTGRPKNKLCLCFISKYKKVRKFTVLKSWQHLYKNNLTRITTLMIAKLKNLDEHWQIKSVSKLILKNHYSKGNYPMSKINMFKWTYGLFVHSYRVATFFTFCLIVSGMIITNMKLLEPILTWPNQRIKKTLCLKWTYWRSSLNMSKST